MRFATAIIAITLCVPHAAAQQHDLNKFLVGKWRLPTPAGYNEILFRADGFFKITIVQRGVHEQAYLSGTWEIRSGRELWTHNLAWYPIYVRHFNGTRTKVQMPAWQSTIVEMVDADHMKSSSGVATRMKQ